jgi:hypothetical protein
MADSVVVQLGDGVTCPFVQITITQTADGVFHFNVDQDPNNTGLIGDLRGLFFDLNHETLVSGTGTQATLTGVSATGTNVGSLGTLVADGNDSVTKVGGSDNNMNGALAFDGTGQEAKGYDVGIEFGSAGIGAVGNDVRDVSFDLHLTGATLADFIGVDFGVRMMSVGTLGGARDGSCKETSLSFQPVDDPNESIDCVLENQSATGDIVQGTIPGNAANGNVTVTQTLTSFTLDGTTYTFDATHTSFEVALPDTEGAKITINNDGTYTVVSGDDALGASDHIDFQVDYSIEQTYTDQFGHVIGHLTDTSKLEFDICGENDNPVAINDEPACIVESTTTLVGNVLTNDSDIDRDDDGLLHVTKIGNEDLGADNTATVMLANGAELVINADGSYEFHTNDAYDYLNAEDPMVKETFTYTVADGHGGTTEATLEICIDGEGGGDPGNPPDGPDNFPTFNHALSNAYFYLDTNDNGLADTKVQVVFDQAIPLFDLDDSDVDGQELTDWVLSQNAGSSLIAVSIHAGEEAILSDGSHVQIPGAESVLHNGEGPSLWLWNDSDLLFSDYTDLGAIGNPNQAPDNPPPTAEMLSLGLDDIILGSNASTVYQYSLIV